MTRREPKLPLSLRIIAAGCAVLWLAGVTACNLEALLGCDSHQHASATHSDHEDSNDVAAADSEAHHEHDADAHPSVDAEHHPAAHGGGDSHGSHKHDGKESSCCSTLKAVVQSAKSITVPKQVLQPFAPLCALLDGRIFTLDMPDTASARPPPSRQWTFTPEVCTGPANRSHAPPLHLI